MSTTFGVKIPASPELGIYEAVTEIAFRSNGIRFINPLAVLLADNVPVIPLDNTAQGIFTIGDVKRAIREKNKLEIAE